MDQNKPVYICSPLSASNREQMLANMQTARNHMREVSEELHCRALAPHAWLPELLDDNNPTERGLALDFGVKLLRLCGTLIVCHPSITKGMAIEITLAQELGLTFLAHPAPGKYYPPKRIPKPGVCADWGAWGF